MTQRPRAALIGIALALMLVPLAAKTASAKQPDIDAAAAAKTKAGQAALSHPAPDPPGPKARGTFITFDVPGAVTSTNPASINVAGDITGTYTDANGLIHGFLRARNGAFTTFDVPGGTSTFPDSINPAQAVAGSFFYLDDPNSASHGFLRIGNGTLTLFDVPGGETAILRTAINPEQATTGSFFYLNDPNAILHGFLRTRDGNITTFDAPDAGTTGLSFPQGTAAVDISPDGVILGIYTDANFDNHGFLRARNGSFSSFDSPGQIAAFAPFSFGTNLSMNPAGVIAGTYFQPIAGNPFGGNFRVFVRAADGTFTTFDAATYPPCCIWSFPSGITPSGTIIGSFNDGFTVNHGFLRTSDGTVTTFDVPGAGNGFDQGTAPLGITPAGVIMGVYMDANGVSHGFLFLPQS